LPLEQGGEKKTGSSQEREKSLQHLIETLTENKKLENLMGREAI